METICSYSNPLYFDNTTYTLIAPDGNAPNAAAYNFASSTCETNLIVSNGFTGGEIIISTFLFLIFAMILLKFFLEIIYIWKQSD